MVANGDTKWDILVKGEGEGLRDKEGKLKDDVSLYTHSESSLKGSKEGKLKDDVSLYKLNQKVLLKGAKKAEREMFNDKDREQKIKRLRRLSVLAWILNNIFTFENRAALPFDMVLEKVLFSYPGHLPKDVLHKDLRYLMEITEAWVENPSAQGVEYLKLDKTMDVNEVVEKLEKILEDEETPAGRGSGISDEKVDQEPNSFFSSQVERPLTSARKLEKKLSGDKVKELLEDYTPKYGTEVSRLVLI